ncbi:hypothetical protein K8Z49_32495 [Actinomadura madurae]|uniref:hypothetical protein n=1 Tax=Actinomadura madurae TaxID=1993 RepID=UPI0039997E7A
MPTHDCGSADAVAARNLQTDALLVTGDYILPVEMHYHFESICESCTFFATIT